MEPSGHFSGRFSVLLISLVLVIAVHPFLGGLPFGLLLLELFLSFMLLSSVFALGRSKRLVAAGLALALTGFILRWVYFFKPEPVIGALGLSMIAATMLFVGAVILRRVLTARRVSVDTVLGGLCGYLLLGIIWACLYALIEIAHPGAFRDPLLAASAAAPGASQMAQFSHHVYYSFVTLTTLGYGDITPVTAGARGLASLEAVIGQLYLAVFVAGLVGMHISDRMGGSK